jgi:hypothetical protein
MANLLICHAGIRRNTSSKFDHFSRVSSTEMADSYRLTNLFLLAAYPAPEALSGS